MRFFGHKPPPVGDAENDDEATSQDILLDAVLTMARTNVCVFGSATVMHLAPLLVGGLVTVYGSITDDTIRDFARLLSREVYFSLGEAMTTEDLPGRALVEKQINDDVSPDNDIHFEAEAFFDAALSGDHEGAVRVAQALRLRFQHLGSQQCMSALCSFLSVVCVTLATVQMSVVLPDAVETATGYRSPFGD